MVNKHQQYHRENNLNSSNDPNHQHKVQEIVDEECDYSSTDPPRASNPGPDCQLGGGHEHGHGQVGHGFSSFGGYRPQQNEQPALEQRDSGYQQQGSQPSYGGQQGSDYGSQAPSHHSQGSYDREQPSNYSAGNKASDRYGSDQPSGYAQQGGRSYDSDKPSGYLAGGQQGGASYDSDKPSSYSAGGQQGGASYGSDKPSGYSAGSDRYNSEQPSGHAAGSAGRYDSEAPAQRGSGYDKPQHGDVYVPSEERAATGTTRPGDYSESAAPTQHTTQGGSGVSEGHQPANTGYVGAAMSYVPFTQAWSDASAAKQANAE